MAENTHSDPSAVSITHDYKMKLNVRLVVVR